LNLKIERELAEQERLRLIRALEDSHQKLVHFVDTISHDLRSPLISIGNLAEWVEKDMGEKLDDSSKQNIASLRKRAVKMRLQLNELLEYSKAGNY
ncbi:histidine kinase dimerization/phospho-acceptor domain-containing protein, partial [Enterococcus faecium]|uniref:histidine kinase dimerization/phospho-acceptor domain-containing protein n=1 Tax=Enterococcus faecium TaxID=1352 RepID=UPI003F43D36A